jgi:hypothetical protein
MEHPECGEGRDTPQRYLQARNAKIPLRISDIKLQEEEEEEEGSSYGVPSSEEELGIWWARFRHQYKYPLYCMVLATESDSNVASVIDKYRDELSKIAGDRCCFIYFRDLERAKLLKPFSFHEHAKGVMSFVQLVGIQFSSFPCLLFFENIIGDDYVTVGLENGSESDIVSHIREVFAFIYSRSEISLSAVKAFKFSKHVGVARKSIGKNLTQFTKEMIGELLKSITKIP